MPTPERSEGSLSPRVGAGVILSAAKDPSSGQVVILAGGLGTRLRERVPDRPKALAPILGRPFIDYQFQQLAAERFSDAVLCLGHRATAIQDHVGNGSQHGLRVTCLVEGEPLGTAGALRNARDLLAERFVVLNGDSYLEADLRRLVDWHLRLTRVAAPFGTIGAISAPDVAASGALDLGPDDRVHGFAEKSRAGPGWINGGVYVFERAILDLIPPRSPASLERDVLPDIARQGRLYACRLEGQMIDIGTSSGYDRFLGYVSASQRRA